MANRYIAYESLYYVSEYIKQINETSGGVVWDDQWDEDKKEGELLQMNKKRCMIKSNSLIFHQFSIE